MNSISVILACCAICFSSDPFLIFNYTILLSVWIVIKNKKDKPTFSDLKSKTIKRVVFLFSCRGAEGGLSVADMFADKAQGAKIIAHSGNLSYSKKNGKYYPRQSLKGSIGTWYETYKDSSSAHKRKLGTGTIYRDNDTFYLRKV